MKKSKGLPRRFATQKDTDEETRKHLQPAYDALRARDAAKAVELLTEVVNPTDPRYKRLTTNTVITAYDWLGHAHRELKQYSEAVHYSLRSIQMQTELNCKETLCKADQYARVAQCTLGTFDGDSPTFYLARELEDMVHCCEMADKLYCRFDAKGTKNWMSNKSTWGTALMYQRRYADAARMLHEAMDSTKPSDAQGSAAYATLCCTLGCIYIDELVMPNAAWRCWMRAREACPQYALLLRNMGFFCMVLEQFPWAIWFMEEALKCEGKQDKRELLEHALMHARDRETGCKGDTHGKRMRYAKHRICSHCMLIADNDNILNCACYDAWYCNNGHCQRAAWPEHKMTCSFVN